MAHCAIVEEKEQLNIINRQIVLTVFIILFIKMGNMEQSSNIQLLQWKLHITKWVK
jgi:hypothetical protein